MAAQTVAALGSLKEALHPEFLDSVYKNKDLTRLLVSRDISGSQGSYKVRVKVTSNAASVVSEGGALPAISPTTYQEASFSEVEHHSVYGLSGATLRGLGDNNLNSLNSENDEFRDAFEQVVDLVNTTAMADATTGLLGQIDDDTTNWGSIDRSVYTTLQSHVVAGGSAAMTEAMINNAFYTSRVPPHFSDTELIISGWTQVRRYGEAIIGAADNQGGGIGDVGFAQHRFATKPWVGLADFTASEVAFLTGVTDGSGMFLANFETRYSDPEVEKVQLGPSCSVGISRMPLANDKHEKNYDLCAACALVVLKPWRQAKIEALATSW